MLNVLVPVTRVSSGLFGMGTVHQPPFEARVLVLKAGAQVARWICEDSQSDSTVMLSAAFKLLFALAAYMKVLGSLRAETCGQ